MKLLLLLLPFFCFSGEAERVSRLHALTVLGDHQLAVQNAEAAVQQYPQSKEVLLSAIKIYADAGEEEQMMRSFRSYQAMNKDDPYPRDTLEEMSWGIIEKGAKKNSPMIRAIALIVAAKGNDSRGVRLLLENSGDPHRLVRELVVEFSSHFRDEPLQNMVKERLKVEKDPSVRTALLRAVGPMKITDLEPYLLSVLANDRASAEDKFAAIASIMDLKEEVNLEEVQKLIGSNRAAHRALAAVLIGLHDKKEDASLLLPLLKDSHSEVRKAVLETLGALRVEDIAIEPLLNDSNAEVAITAAWALMPINPAAGQEAMRKWLQSPHADERLYAACALKGAGKYGYPLNLNAFKETNDPYVKLNLACSLIQEQIDPSLGSQAIYEAVTQTKERWMECDLGRFSGIGPCLENHRPDIPHYPEAVNQMTRLEMLNLLAIQKHPQALEAVTNFLKERQWGITGAASALLLTEGDEEALVLIRELLRDDSEKVQMQAALILAIWGNDPHALSTLQRLYHKASHSKKEQIIEALGRIGDFSALPFLVDRLEEAHLSLRMISAAAILQILYH